MSVRDRVIGCVVGLALGDALGPAGGEPTALARNLARSLGERGTFDLDDIVAGHLAWFRTEPPHVESLTRAVLRRVESGEPATEAAQALWLERGPEVSAGNGSVMYCAPLAAAYANRPGELFELAPALSALTHFDGRCRTAVLAVTLATAALVRGEPPASAVTAAVLATLPFEGGEELEFLVDAVGRERRIDGPDQGFCLFAAAAALQAAAWGLNVEPALRGVVALGGDTDANGAVAGALVGAIAGRSGLPAAWLASLEDRSAIESEALRLVPLAEAR
jgi:ADP-ribosyl-[dinitrogen reductase] hydrolase